MSFYAAAAASYVAAKESLANASPLIAFAITAVFFLRAATAEFVPACLQQWISETVSNLFLRIFSYQSTTVFYESDSATANILFNSSMIYLVSRLSGSAGASVRRFCVHKQDDENENFEVRLEEGAELVDVFNGVRFKWRLAVVVQNLPRRYRNNSYHSNIIPQQFRCFELSFNNKHRKLVFNSYLNHVMQQSKAITEAQRTLKLYTNESDIWCSANFLHPGSFDKLAMDEGAKEKIIEDLQRFTGRKEYYKRIGKAWKRGYLLYGPPGTGKSSLIAAMANFLRFNVYDLNLSEVRSNARLRSLIVGTCSRSILVVEDIDCSLHMRNRTEVVDDDQLNGNHEDQVTLSGLLNFVDGLWSSCGDEKIIVFTTNHKDRLDPALLRPGRMDVHIEMGYCGPFGFRTLVENYHCVDGHPLFGEIDVLLGRVNVTPAEVAEELLKSEDAGIALEGLVLFLRGKMEAAE